MPKLHTCTSHAHTHPQHALYATHVHYTHTASQATHTDCTRLPTLYTHTPLVLAFPGRLHSQGGGRLSRATCRESASPPGASLCPPGSHLALLAPPSLHLSRGMFPLTCPSPPQPPPRLSSRVSFWAVATRVSPTSDPTVVLGAPPPPPPHIHSLRRSHLVHLQDTSESVHCSPSPPPSLYHPGLFPGAQRRPTLSLPASTPASYCKSCPGHGWGSSHQTPIRPSRLMLKALHPPHVFLKLTDTLPPVTRPPAVSPISSRNSGFSGRSGQVSIKCTQPRGHSWRRET